MSANPIMSTTKHSPKGERGAALVIAIFSLLLISVVATALIVTAGTQTAIKSNYKSAMQAFYYAKAGVEEARGRLWASTSGLTADPLSACVFPTGQPMQVGQVCYIRNPANGETVNPLDPANAYADSEYAQEWGGPPPNSAQIIDSTSSVAGMPGPLYKWVRITPRTDSSANFGTNNSPVFFDGAYTNSIGPSGQVFTITALAVTPSNSRRMVQYTVAPNSFAAAVPTFPAALTLDGNGVTFTPPSNGNNGNGNGNGNGGGQNNGSGFQISGIDASVQGTASGVPAIGYINPNDYSNSNSGLSVAAASSNFTSPSGVPNVALLSPATQGANGLSSSLQTPGGLDALVQSIAANADAVLTGPLTQSDANNLMPSGMSATNPVVVVINGDFTFNGWHNTGYGVLVVTGQLKYDPDATWNGIIMVIGKGAFVSNQTGQGQINGAMLIANTRDSLGNLLSALGPASFTQTGGGNGIRYSSNWVNAAQRMLPYQVLSFREISQTTP